MRTLSCLLLSLIIAAGVFAQHVPAPIVTDASGFAHQVKLFQGAEETRYRQLVSPVSVSIPFGSGHLKAESAFMYVQIEDTDGRRDISGPLDTQISGEWRLGNAMITGYANLPSGLDSLDANEAGMVRALTRNDLNFPVKAFGHGLDFGGAITLGKQVGHWAISAGGGYLKRGSYSPFVGVSDYEPGDEVTVTGGVGYTVGGLTLGADLAGKMIRMDRMGGVIVFRNGKQFTGVGSLLYESRVLRLHATVTEIVRLKDVGTRAGAPLYEASDSNGNDLRADGRLEIRPLEGLTVFGEAHFKNLTENAYDPSDELYHGAARLWAYGGGVSVKIGSTEALTVRVMKGDGWINDRSDDVETLNGRVSVRLYF